MRTTIPAGQLSALIDLSAAPTAPIGAANVTVQGRAQGIPGQVYSPGFTISVQKR
jgi:hypothetical protein